MTHPYRASLHEWPGAIGAVGTLHLDGRAVFPDERAVAVIPLDATTDTPEFIAALTAFVAHYRMTRERAA